MRRLSFCLIAALSAACAPASEPPDDGAERTIAVTTVVAATQPLPRTFETGGVVQARAAAIVSSRIVATVRERRVIAGDRVRAGQPLVLLDGRDLEANQRGAAAAVIAEQRALQAAEADRDAAGAALALASASHARISQLHARRAATAQELDAATESLHSAEARRAGAEARAAAAAAALDASRATASAASVGASFAAVTAPFDGVVTETFVDPGDLASPGVPLVRVEDTGSFRLEVMVDESWVAAIDRELPVEVRFDPAAYAAEGLVVSGRVVEVARTVDPASHSFAVKVQLPPSTLLRSGMFARARFQGPTRSALVIPREAVARRGQLPTVFVVSDGRVRERILRVADAAGGVEVVAGLAPGEEVVVQPPPSLRDGDRVEIRR